MAKDEKGGKIRVVVFELEGSNETLQESLRTVASALGRSGNVVRGPVIAYPPTHIENAPIPSIAENMTSAEEEEFDVIESEPKKVPAERTKRNRTVRTPAVLELDLTSGDPSFAAFVASKNPSTVRDKYLIIAAWLKEYRQVEPIGQEHIYTCFRAMGWGVQKDLGATFRTGKRDGFFNSTGRGSGNYIINHIGLDRVRKMH